MAEFEINPVVQGTPVEVRPGRRLSLAHRPGTNPRGHTLFFAHGGGGNKDQWRELWSAPRLAEHNLVAWDLLGHGASERPRAVAAYAWDELVADQLAILERFAGERNILVAHSFGTALSLCALQRLTGPTVDGVLLLGTQLQAPPRSKLLQLPVWVLELIRPVLAKGFRQAAWHPDTDPALVAYEEALSNSNALHVFKALISQCRWIPKDIVPLGMPVRILSGEADRVTPPMGAKALAEQLQSDYFEVVERTAHQLMLERSDVVLENVLALLAGDAACVT